MDLDTLRAAVCGGWRRGGPTACALRCACPALLPAAVDNGAHLRCLQVTRQAVELLPLELRKGLAPVRAVRVGQEELQLYSQATCHGCTAAIAVQEQLQMQPQLPLGGPALGPAQGAESHDVGSQQGPAEASSVSPPAATAAATAAATVAATAAAMAAATAAAFPDSPNGAGAAVSDPTHAWASGGEHPAAAAAATAQPDHPAAASAGTAQHDPWTLRFRPAAVELRYMLHHGASLVRTDRSFACLGILMAVLHGAAALSTGPALKEEQGQESGAVPSPLVGGGMASAALCPGATAMLAAVPAAVLVLAHVDRVCYLRWREALCVLHLCIVAAAVVVPLEAAAWGATGGGHGVMGMLGGLARLVLETLAFKVSDSSAVAAAGGGVGQEWGRVQEAGLSGMGERGWPASWWL